MADAEVYTGVAVVLVGLWSLYRYLSHNKDQKNPGADAANIDVVKPAPPTNASGDSSDEPEVSMTSNAVDDLRSAAASYGQEYQDRMKATTAAAGKARPFIGFSLADNIVEGALVVDGVFIGGPADQTGVDIDHELTSINGKPAHSIDQVRALIAAHCRPGQVTRMRLRKAANGAGSPTPAMTEYEVMLWVMTTEEKLRGRPYFFDPTLHKVRQSERMKQSWTPDASPKK